MNQPQPPYRPTSPDPAPRRGALLRLFGAPLAATAIAPLAAADPTPAAAAASTDDASPPGNGYRVTDHVRRYYRLARF